MDKIIPRYQLNEARITIFASRELKEMWDELSRTHGVRVGQITREFLEATLPEILKQLREQARTEGPESASK